MRVSTQRYISLSRIQPDEPSEWWRYRGGREFLCLLAKRSESWCDEDGTDSIRKINEVISYSTNYFHLALLISVSQREAESVNAPIEAFANQKMFNTTLLIVMDRITTFDDEVDIYHGQYSQQRQQQDAFVGYCTNSQLTFDQWLELPGIFVLDMTLGDNDESNKSMTTNESEVVSVKLFQFPNESPFERPPRREKGENRSVAKERKRETADRIGQSRSIEIMRNHQFLSVMAQSGILYLWRYHYTSSCWKLFCDFDFYQHCCSSYLQNNSLFSSSKEETLSMMTKHLWIDESHHRLIRLEERTVKFHDEAKASREIMLFLHEFQLVNDEIFSISPSMKLLSIPITQFQTTNLQCKYEQDEGILYILNYESEEWVMYIYVLLEGKLRRILLHESLARSKCNNSHIKLSSVEMVSADFIYNIIYGPVRLEATSWKSEKLKSADKIGSCARICLLINHQYICLFNYKYHDPSNGLTCFTVSYCVSLPKSIHCNPHMLLQVEELLRDQEFDYIALLLQDGVVMIQQLPVRGIVKDEEDTIAVISISSLRLLNQNIKVSDNRPSLKLLCGSLFSRNSYATLSHSFDSESSNCESCGFLPLILTSNAIYNLHVNIKDEKIDVNYKYQSLLELLRYLFEDSNEDVHGSKIQSEEISYGISADGIDHHAVTKSQESKSDAYFKTVDQFLFELMERHVQSKSVDKPSSMLLDGQESMEDFICFQHLSVVTLSPYPSTDFDIAGLGKIIDPLVLVQLSKYFVQTVERIDSIDFNQSHDTCSDSPPQMMLNENVSRSLLNNSFKDTSEDEIHIDAEDEEGDDGSEEGGLFRDVHSDSETEHEIDNETLNAGGYCQEHIDANPSVIGFSKLQDLEATHTTVEVTKRKVANGPLSFVLRAILLTHPKEAYVIVNLFFDFRDMLLNSITDFHEYHEDDTLSSLMKSVPTFDERRSHGESISTPRRNAKYFDDRESSTGDFDMRSVASHEEEYQDVEHEHVQNNAQNSSHGEGYFHRVDFPNPVVALTPPILKSSNSNSQRFNKQINEVSPLQEILMYKVHSHSKNQGFAQSLAFNLQSPMARSESLSVPPARSATKYDKMSQEPVNTQHNHPYEQDLDIQAAELSNRFDDSGLRYHCVSLISNILTSYVEGSSQTFMEHKNSMDILCGSLLRSLPNEGFENQNTLLKILLRCGMTESTGIWLSRLHRPLSLAAFVVRVSATANFLHAECIRWQAILEWSAMRQKRERVSLSKLLNQSYTPEESPMIRNESVKSKKENPLQTFKKYLSREAFLLMGGNPWPSSLPQQFKISFECLEFFQRYYGSQEVTNYANVQSCLLATSTIKEEDMKCNLFMSPSSQDVIQSPDEYDDLVIKNQMHYYRQHLQSLQALSQERNLLASRIFLNAICDFADGHFHDSSLNLEVVLKSMVALRPISVSFAEIRDGFMMRGIDHSNDVIKCLQELYNGT